MDTSQQVEVTPQGRESSVAAQGQRPSIAKKRRIVEETLFAGASVARAAWAHGVKANQVFYWRKVHQAGQLGGSSRAQLLSVRVRREASPATIAVIEPGSFAVSFSGTISPRTSACTSTRRGQCRSRLTSCVAAVPARMIGLPASTRI